MRKNLSKIIALSLMTSAMFVSCSNETSKVLDASPKSVGLTLKLPKMEQTKLIGPQTTSSQKVTLAGQVIIYALASENGAILNTYTLEAKDFFGTDGNPIKKTLEVNGTAEFMKFEGNIDAGARTNDVNTRQGDATSSAVRVSGGAAIQDGLGSNGTCSIPVSPDMARIEVFGSLGTSFTNISDLKINGIYLNNVKQERNSTSLTKTTTTSTPAWSTVYAKDGSKSNLYTLFSPGVDGIENNGSIAQSDGYNFYPQDYKIVASLSAGATNKEEALQYSPHIVLNVSYTQNGTAYSNKWLNVVALKNGANYFASFDNGKVYQLNLEDLIPIMDHVTPPVTDEPDPNAISVTVDVSVADWVVVSASPEV